jgi:hypothetical protein
MTFRLLILTGMITLTSFAAHAEVYRHVDAQGNVTFSDEPIEGGETIQVKPVTTVTLPKPQDVQDAPEVIEQAREEGERYTSVSIASPSDGEAFHSGSGNVQIQVTSSPALQPGHRYEVTLDGQPVGQTTSGSVTVNHIDRGTHEAAAHIINENGIRVRSGDTISFTVHRPSRLN